MKNCSSTYSLAAKCTTCAYIDGVGMKENTSHGSLGMNPNFNVEDEYIENLLKQIHFMNLEIKLMKEKQSKSDGNALWGVINRSGQPYISNIVQSSKKYEEMKRNTNSVISKLEKQNVILENQQNALLAEIKFLESKKNTLNSQKQQWKTENQLKQYDLDEKIGQKKKRRDLLQLEIQKQQEKNQKFTKDFKNLMEDEHCKKTKGCKQRIQIENDETIEEMMEKDKDEEIANLNNNIGKLEELFAQNADYQKALEEQNGLKKRLNNLDKSVSAVNFDLMQLNQSIKMATSQREKEIVGRKKITQDFQLTKTMLQQILFMNFARKQKQSQSKKKQSPQICNAEEQSQKLEKNLKQIKTKLINSEQIHQKMKCQVDGYNKQIQENKAKQKDLKQKFKQIMVKNQERDSQLLKLNTQIRAIQDQCDKVMQEDLNSSQDLFKLEKQMQFLKARKVHLQENSDLKDILSGFKIQDLHRVVQKNNDLNSTVSTLMGKWEEIKNFSRI